MLPGLSQLHAQSKPTVQSTASTTGGDSIERGALSGERFRVVVSTDIGGTDPDDFQSMVHLLLYADVLDIEALISSPFGPGRKEHILQVLDCYEQDYRNLRTYSDRYPSPDALRAVTYQGAFDEAPFSGVSTATEGSKRLIECARRDDARPLFVLIWGGIEDLAQALHDAPDILPKLRVYFIGGPNKKWSVNAYEYIARHHPSLWMIEANDTYRGWFVGGDQSGEWKNDTFIQSHIVKKGALGDFFAKQLGEIKMGDTPSVAWLLRGIPTEPAMPGWGGQFVQVWDRQLLQLNRMPNREDRMDEFGVLEIELKSSGTLPDNPRADLIVENQTLIGDITNDGKVRFRFCPKAIKTFQFRVRSNIPGLNDQTGEINSVRPTLAVEKTASARFTNWWTDNPAPELAEGSFMGAKTVSRWRQQFLSDFAQRLERCASENKQQLK